MSGFFQQANHCHVHHLNAYLYLKGVKQLIVQNKEVKKKNYKYLHFLLHINFLVEGYQVFSFLSLRSRECYSSMKKRRGASSDLGAFLRQKKKLSRL